MRKTLPQYGIPPADVKPVPVLAVKKALDLLGILAFEDVRREGIRLSDLAARLGVPLNTARNLLKTMIACGFVAQTERSLYVVGPVTERLGLVNRLASTPTVTAVTAILRDLAARFGEGVVFAVLSDGQRVVLAEADSNHQIRTVSEPRGTRNFYSYPTGRVLAAYASAVDRQRIVERHGLPGDAWDNIAGQAELAQALETLRRDGACVLQERDSQVVGIAVPALEADGTLLGALGLHAPAFRCPAPRRREIVRALRVIAAELPGKL